MLHDLTLGHLDPEAVLGRQRVVLKPLEMNTVRRLLTELGGTDAAGNPTLGGAKVRFEQGNVVIPWLGGSRNRVSEEFALRLHQETGCVIAECVKGDDAFKGDGMNSDRLRGPKRSA